MAFRDAYRLELDGVYAGMIECNPERKEVWIQELNTQHPLFLAPGKTDDDPDDSAVWHLARDLPDCGLRKNGTRFRNTGEPFSFGSGELDLPRFRDEVDRKRREAVFSKIFLRAPGMP